MTHVAYWGDHDGPNFGDILNKPLLDQLRLPLGSLNFYYVHYDYR